MRERERALLAAIADAPDDDAPRLVYADAIAEAGDVARAELIHLQLARARTGTPPSAHELALVAAHGKSWIVPIAPVLEDWTFERGFLERCTLRGRAKSANIVGNPLWATVRDATLRAGDPSAILLHPIMRNLRVVRSPRFQSLVQLCRSAAPIEELIGIDHRALQQQFELAFYVIELRGLPRLRRIAFIAGEPSHAPRVWAHALDRAGMTLQFDVRSGGLAPWWQTLIHVPPPRHAAVIIATSDLESRVDHTTGTVTVELTPVSAANGIWDIALALGLGPPVVTLERGAIRRLAIHAPKGHVRNLTIGFGDRTEAMFDAVRARARALDIELELVER
jgi:uncharacterized protein (TIGR02996 family)